VAAGADSTAVMSMERWSDNMKCSYLQGIGLLNQRCVVAILMSILGHCVHLVDVFLHGALELALGVAALVPGDFTRAAFVLCLTL